MDNYKHDGRRIEGPVGSGGVKSGHMVKISAGLIVEATDGCDIWGVACDSVDEGGIVAVAGRLGEVFEFTAHTGVNFALGDPAYVRDAVTLDAGSSTNHSAGIVVDFDPDSAGKVYIQMTPPDMLVGVKHA